MDDYHDLYLNAILLANVFEKFIGLLLLNLLDYY